MAYSSMRVVVFGAGLVGEALGRHIADQGNNVCFIEANANTVRKIREQMDVQIVHGTAEDQEALREAGVQNADLILAVTNQDKSNIILTLIARSLNPMARIITRVRDEEFLDNRLLWKSSTLADTIVISPERAVIEKAIHILEVQHAFDVVEFLDGELRIAGFRLSAGNLLAGKPLKKSHALFPSANILVVGAERGDEVIIPTGETILEEGDRIFLTLPQSIDLHAILPLLGKRPVTRQKFVIAGGSAIGEHIARQLALKGQQAVIIESDYERCVTLSETLKNAILLHGDVTDASLLSRAITPETVFLAVTASQEVNFLISLLAQKRGAMQVITMMDNEAYYTMAPELGVDAILSPRAAAVGSILRFIRMGRVLDANLLLGGKLDIFLTEIKSGSSLDNISLKDVEFPQGVIVAAAIRNKDVVVPHGNLRMQEGDFAVFVIRPGRAAVLDDLIAPRRTLRLPL
ncbi:MAG: Trk system potassium transporter TrkA [Magnetococcales bacterium]|nr:Trk system potassium transporter TrkA [Magnetococcales bacterium]